MMSLSRGIGKKLVKECEYGGPVVQLVSSFKFQASVLSHVQEVVTPIDAVVAATTAVKGSQCFFSGHKL